MIIETIKKIKPTLSRELNSQDGRAKIQDLDLITGLLYAAATSTSNFTLATLRLAVCSFLGKTIGKSAFNERMGTASLLRHMELVLKTLMGGTSPGDETSEMSKLVKKLGVKSIIGVDGSLVSLWDGLAEHFKGTFMTAAIKLHFAINLLTGEATWLELTEGKTHDSVKFPDIEREQLYVFDLGYWSSNLFERIVGAGAYFLSRIKGNTSFKITKIVSGRLSKKHRGKKISELPSGKCYGKVIELRVDNGNLSLRAIGFWNEIERCYHWYLTNLTAKAEIIATLYRLRWQVELSFKSMKSVFNLDRIPTLSPNTTQTLCLLAVCNYMMAMKLRYFEIEVPGQKRREAKKSKSSSKKLPKLSLQRAATVFRTVAYDVFKILQTKYRMTSGKLQAIEESILLLIGTYYDPNYNIRSTTEKAVLEGVT